MEKKTGHRRASRRTNVAMALVGGVGMLGFANALPAISQDRQRSTEAQQLAVKKSVSEKIVNNCMKSQGIDYLVSNCTTNVQSLRSTLFEHDALATTSPRRDQASQYLVDYVLRYRLQQENVNESATIPAVVAPTPTVPVAPPVETAPVEATTTTVATPPTAPVTAPETETTTAPSPPVTAPVYAPVSTTTTTVAPVVNNQSYGESQAMYDLFQFESSNIPTNVNPSSGACGLGQSDPCYKLLDACGTLSNVACQIDFFTNYVDAKYGGWPQAYAYDLAHHSY